MKKQNILTPTKVANITQKFTKSYVTTAFDQDWLFVRDFYERAAITDLLYDAEDRCNDVQRYNELVADPDIHGRLIAYEREQYLASPT